MGINAPMSASAILVIDMMNTYRHPDADKLIPHVEPIVEPLSENSSQRRRIATTWT